MTDTKNDKYQAQSIREMVRLLNSMIDSAVNAGMSVELDIARTHRAGESQRELLSVKVSREL